MVGARERKVIPKSIVSALAQISLKQTNAGRFSKGGICHRRLYGRFERINGTAAEALDCVVYALAVRGLVNIRMDTRENELRALPSTKGGIPNKIPSAWMRRI